MVESSYAVVMSGSSGVEASPAGDAAVARGAPPDRQEPGQVGRELRSGEHDADARDEAADRREIAADRREIAADRREIAADRREAEADQREMLADERQERADHREAALDALAWKGREPAASRLRREEEGLARATEKLDRSQQLLKRLWSAEAREERLCARDQSTIERESAQTGLGGGGLSAEERTARASRRDEAAEQREMDANRREADADERDKLADEREQRADDREREADERDVAHDLLASRIGGHLLSYAETAIRQSQERINCSRQALRRSRTVVDHHPDR